MYVHVQDLVWGCFTMYIAGQVCYTTALAHCKKQVWSSHIYVRMYMNLYMTYIIHVYTVILLKYFCLGYMYVYMYSHGNAVIQVVQKCLSVKCLTIQLVTWHLTNHYAQKVCFISLIALFSAFFYNITIQRSVHLLQTQILHLAMAVVLLGRVPAEQLRLSPCHTWGNGNAGNATPYHDKKSLKWLVRGHVTSYERIMAWTHIVMSWLCMFWCGALTWCNNGLSCLLHVHSPGSCALHVHMKDLNHLHN